MEADPKTVFGPVLRRLRRDRDLSQDALAGRARLARNHVSELERARRDPSLATVIQLTDALDMTMGEMGNCLDAERARRRGA
jgi:transcriptional regulator with XRE-family HTH domain